MSFLAEVKTKILEAKFILEQDKSLEGNAEAIERLRNALDLCTLAERLIDTITPKETRDRLIADTLSSSLARPKLQSVPETITDAKDEPREP